MSASDAVAAERLDDSVFQLMFEGCVPERCRAGHVLFMQDDPADRIYAVLSGRVEISLLSPGGRKLVANIETEKALIGEVATLDGGARTATAACMTECRILSISRAQLLERVERHPQLALAMIHILCRRIRRLSAEIGDQALLATDTRLAKRLIALQEIIGAPDRWITLSQSELAEFLGVTRESVNKILKDWQQRDIVEARRGALRILNAARLNAIAATEDE